MVKRSFSVGGSLNDTLCLVRQVLTTFVSYKLILLSGFNLGYSANVLDQLAEDEHIDYDEEIGSWIASIGPLCMSLGCLIIGGILDRFGRKVSHIAIALPNILGWLLMAFAVNSTMLLFGRAITGLCSGAARTATFVYVSEITDPRYRGVLLLLSSLSLHIGVLLIHLITYYVNWRISSLICAVVAIATSLLIVFIKESPVWLLRQGNEKNGVLIFKIFRGQNERALKELDKMIESAKLKPEKLSFCDKSRLFFRFIKPFVIGCIIIVTVQFCGINLLAYYAKDVFENTFGGSIDAFLMIMVTDVTKTLIIFVACVLVKFISRRVLYLLATYLTVILLISIIVFLYLKPNNLVWLLVVLMLLYICGVTFIVAVGWSLVSEIMPTDIRGFCTGLITGISYMLLFIVVKVSPGIMAKYGQIGQFTMNASLTFLCCLILTFTIPDTDDKTLQEIEDKYKNDNRK